MAGFLSDLLGGKSKEKTDKTGKFLDDGPMGASKTVKDKKTYDKYVIRTQEDGEKPMSFEEWKKQ